MAIATQRKQGTEAKGALDTVYWAMCRGLVAFNKAELNVQSSSSSSSNVNKDVLTKNLHEKDDANNECNNSKSVFSEEDKSF